MQSSRESEVHQIEILEIEFGDASGTFDDHEVIGLTETRIGIENAFKKEIKMLVVILRA